MTLYSVNECVEQMNFWAEKVVTAAQLQGVTEGQYDRLVAIARAGIILVNQLQAGDTVSETWIAERDILVRAASAIVEDIPQKKEREE